MAMRPGLHPGREDVAWSGVSFQPRVADGRRFLEHFLKPQFSGMICQVRS